RRREGPAPRPLLQILPVTLILSLQAPSTMMQNTKYVVDYIVSSRFEAIPAQALAVAKGAMQDCVGVALAGARHAAGAIPAAWARTNAGMGSAGASGATVWGQDFKTSAH